jgi:hypothetical protein
VLKNTSTNTRKLFLGHVPNVLKESSNAYAEIMLLQAFQYCGHVRSLAEILHPAAFNNQP